MKVLPFQTHDLPQPTHDRVRAAETRALCGHRSALWLSTSLVATSVAAGLDEARAAAFPPVIELRKLEPALGGDGSIGFVLKGINEEDSSGISVSGAADLNGDGMEDLLIGAAADSNGRADAGESYVVFGRATGLPASFELRRLHPANGGDGSQGAIFMGMDDFDLSGLSVSSLGDVDGDGIDDVIIGAPRADPNGEDGAGESYVLFGRTTGFPAMFALRRLLPAFGGDGSEGFVLQGTIEFDHAGWAVSAAGDVNGDGIDDVLVGAYTAGPRAELLGQSYVVFGRTSGFPAAFELRGLHPEFGGDGSEGFVLRGVDGDDLSGRSVSGAGDVNGDGLYDVIIGSSNANDDAGESYVVFGRTTGFPALFPLEQLLPELGGDGSEGFVLQGIDSFDFAGGSVSGAGDVNGDGVDDLLIGARWADPEGRDIAGETYLVFGRTSGFPAAFELSRLEPEQGGDGGEGVILRGIREGDESAFSVRGAGDVNADGIDDVIIGADLADPNGRSVAGESYVVFGRGTGFPAVFELARLRPALGGDGSRGVILEGHRAGDNAGFSVSGAGDVNDDGIDDVIIGAPGADPRGRGEAGVSYVVFGRGDGSR